MVIRLIRVSTSVIIVYIPRKVARESRLAAPIDHVPVEALQPLDEANALLAHREGGRREAIGLVDVGADHGQADDIGHERAVRLWVVNMLSADRCARGRDSAVADREHLHDLIHVEGVADADAPGLALAVLSNRLDIASGVD